MTVIAYGTVHFDRVTMTWAHAPSVVHQLDPDMGIYAVIQACEDAEIEGFQIVIRPTPDATRYEVQANQE